MGRLGRMATEIIAEARRTGRPLGKIREDDAARAAAREAARVADRLDAEVAAAGEPLRADAWSLDTAYTDALVAAGPFTGVYTAAEAERSYPGWLRAGKPAEWPPKVARPSVFPPVERMAWEEGQTHWSGSIKAAREGAESPAFGDALEDDEDVAEAIASSSTVTAHVGRMREIGQDAVSGETLAAALSAIDREVRTLDAQVDRGTEVAAKLGMGLEDLREATDKRAHAVNGDLNGLRESLTRLDSIVGENERHRSEAHEVVLATVRAVTDHATKRVDALEGRVGSLEGNVAQHEASLGAVTVAGASALAATKPGTVLYALGRALADVVKDGDRKVRERRDRVETKPMTFGGLFGGLPLIEDPAIPSGEVRYGLVMDGMGLWRDEPEEPEARYREVRDAHDRLALKLRAEKTRGDRWQERAHEASAALKRIAKDTNNPAAGPDEVAAQVHAEHLARLEAEGALQRMALAVGITRDRVVSPAEVERTVVAAVKGADGRGETLERIADAMILGPEAYGNGAKIAEAVEAVVADLNATRRLVAAHVNVEDEPVHEAVQRAREGDRQWIEWTMAAFDALEKAGHRPKAADKMAAAVEALAAERHAARGEWLPDSVREVLGLGAGNSPVSVVDAARGAVAERNRMRATLARIVAALGMGEGTDYSPETVVEFVGDVVRERDDLLTRWTAGGRDEDAAMVRQLREALKLDPNDPGDRRIDPIDRLRDKLAKAEAVGVLLERYRSHAGRALAHVRQARPPLVNVRNRLEAGTFHVAGGMLSDQDVVRAMSEVEEAHGLLEQIE